MLLNNQDSCINLPQARFSGWYTRCISSYEHKVNKAKKSSQTHNPDWGSVLENHGM
jgi:hypothetical protein